MKSVKSILTVIFGNFILAVSVVYFVLPYEVLSGGVAGVSLIVQGVWNVDPALMIDILMIGLFLIGWIFLGKNFAAKTALSSIVYPIFVTILNHFPYEYEAEPLIVAIFGAVLAGYGVGIVFKEDASTGGMDIPGLIVNKFTGIPVSKIFMISDSIVVLLGLFVCGAERVMIGLIYTYVTNMVINKVMVPKTDSAVSLFIITSHKEEISEFIHVDLYRGTTILAAKGGYTGEDREVLLTVVAKKQYLALEKKIKEIDPTAFVIISDAKDVKGEGFTYDIRV